MLTGFDAQASGAILDLTGDDDQMMRAKKNCVKWDAKKKKYVKADQVIFWMSIFCQTLIVHLLILFLERRN